MNIKRFLFWAGFIIVLVLIIWGLIVAMGKTPVTPGQNLGTPAPVTADDHVFGPSDAPVTVVEYSDFQCPACQMYYFLMEKVLASSTVPVRLVYRHFPLPYHLNALSASIASESAGIQGKFWEMHRLIFENQIDWENTKNPTSIFVGYATEIGLDVERFKTDLASSTLKAKVEASVDEGIKTGINATPTFFVNGKVISNPASYDEFKTIIEQAAI